MGGLANEVQGEIRHFRKNFPAIVNILIATLIFLIASPSSIFAQDKNPTEFPVVSYKNLAIEDLNMQITSAEKNSDEWMFNPLSIAMRFHKVSDLRFVNIKQKSDRAECPLKSVVTIVEEGFLDDQLRGRWTEFHFERKDCSKAWRIKEVREAYLCGREGSEDVFLKKLCPETNADPVTDVSVKMAPTTANIPCDGFPYTFDVRFMITVNRPTTVTFQRMRSDGAVAPEEIVTFSEAGTKEFHDYFRVGVPGDYWFRVEVLHPNKTSGQATAKVICHERN